jgi:hypothetical protein
VISRRIDFMTDRAVLAELLAFPRTFKDGGVSPKAWSAKFAYTRRSPVVTQEQLISTLEEHPSAVDDWIQYCKDFRGSDIWAIEQARNGAWRVYWLASVGSRREGLTFQSRAAACAAFIQLYLESLTR